VNQRLSATFFLFLIFMIDSSISAGVYSQTSDEVRCAPVDLAQCEFNTPIERSIYKVNANFSAEDSVVFLTKETAIKINSVKFINPNELSFELIVLPEFAQLGPKKLAVVNSQLTPRLAVTLPVVFQRWPTIERIWVKSPLKTIQDTLQLQASGVTAVDLILKGHGFFPGSEVHFDDSEITVLNDAQNRLIFPPDSLIVRLVIDPKKPPACGYQRFVITSPHALEGQGRILVRQARAPVITSTLNNFIPDGSEYKFEITGTHFSNNAEVSALPPIKNSRATVSTPEKIQLYLTLPVQQDNQSYRVVVTNPDGQADTSNYFFAMAKPLEKASARSATSRELFSGHSALIAVTVKLKRLERLNSRIAYEINFGTDRFPVERLHDDSTLIARVRLPKSPGDSPLNYHHFTVGEMGQTAKWKGILVAKTPPTIGSITGDGIIHPNDTLQVMLKGTYLDGIKIIFEDPEMSCQVLETTPERIRLLIIAGQVRANQAFPLTLEKGGVQFEHTHLKIEVRDWERFPQFVALEIPATGTIAPQRLWSGQERIIKIKSNDFILLKFYGREINPELGEQKILVSGFLLDSVSTIRAETFEKKMIKLRHGNEIVTWRFRVRQRIRSGDRIEIVISNPGNRNRTAEYFYVERHWYEAFRASSSIPLIKIPTSGGKTELLKNVAFGINWLPWMQRKFISFNGEFIVGNPTSTDEAVNIEIGFGISAILLNYIQLGIGSNLTGEAFKDSFLFLGTRLRMQFTN